MKIYVISVITLALTAIAVMAPAMGTAGEGTIHRHLRGDGTLTLFRPVKNERKTFAYRNESGEYDAAVLEDIAQFFRCRMTSEINPIDPTLIELLDAIEDHFDGREVRLISAYRSPTRNGIMKRRGRRVARRSYHMFGRAADIEVSGIAPYRVRNFAYSLKQGGIGYYRRRPFIHVDTGPLRTWGWMPPATLRRRPATAQK